MPIPDWNDYGLLPEGIHECDMNEIEDRLGFNDRRMQLIDGLRQTIEWLGTMPPIDSLIVDGSFVTDKEHPGDIDAVAMLNNLTEHNQRNWFRAWQPQHEGIKHNFNVELFPTVTGVGNDFSAYFQYLRMEEAIERGAPLGLVKGILRIAP